jgi:small subunit ribosomal protein S2
MNDRKESKDADAKPAKAKKEKASEDKSDKKETEAKADKKAPVVEEVPADKAEPTKPAGEENKASE